MKHTDFTKAANIHAQITTLAIQLERMDKGQLQGPFTAHISSVPILTVVLSKAQVREKLVTKLAELKTDLGALGIESEPEGATQ